MDAWEIVLFVAVVGLGLALVIVVVAPRFRLRSLLSPPGAPGPHAPVAETAGHAPLESAPLVAPSTSARPSPPPPPPEAKVCPTCRRQFAGGLKFCPYDARLLARDLHPGLSEPDIALGAGAAKICPSCARTYDTVAVVCGRDGAALVSVN